MTTYIVAVSGGVDSVVLLDMLASGRWTMDDGRLKTASTIYSLSSTDHYIVAHFDHGIRDDSAADARFVAGLARQYGLPYEARREELGQSVSEAVAREYRYAFLREVAKKHSGTIVTAHHADDVIETVAINLYRGTGWRGLAVFGDTTVQRPLQEKTKAELYNYALRHKLEWVEDSTNQTDAYLRNRLRSKLGRVLPPARRSELYELWRSQRLLRATVEAELQQLLETLPIDRYTLTHCGDMVARELLRAFIEREAARAPAWPQIDRTLLMIKTARSGARIEVGDGIALGVTARTITVHTPEKVL